MLPSILRRGGIVSCLIAMVLGATAPAFGIDLPSGDGGSQAPAPPPPQTPIDLPSGDGGSQAPAPPPPQTPAVTDSITPSPVPAKKKATKKTPSVSAPTPQVAQTPRVPSPQTSPRVDIGPPSRWQLDQTLAQQAEGMRDFVEACLRLKRHVTSCWDVPSIRAVDGNIARLKSSSASPANRERARSFLQKLVNADPQASLKRQAQDKLDTAMKEGVPSHLYFSKQLKYLVGRAKKEISDATVADLASFFSGTLGEITATAKTTRAQYEALVAKVKAIKVKPGLPVTAVFEPCQEAKTTSKWVKVNSIVCMRMVAYDYDPKGKKKPSFEALPPTLGKQVKAWAVYLPMRDEKFKSFTRQLPAKLNTLLLASARAQARDNIETYAKRGGLDQYLAQFRKWGKSTSKYPAGCTDRNACRPALKAMFSWGYAWMPANDAAVKVYTSCNKSTPSDFACFVKAQDAWTSIASNRLAELNHSEWWQPAVDIINTHPIGVVLAVLAVAVALVIMQRRRISPIRLPKPSPWFMLAVCVAVVIWYLRSQGYHLDK